LSSASPKARRAGKPKTCGRSKLREAIYGGEPNGNRLYPSFFCRLTLTLCKWFPWRPLAKPLLVTLRTSVASSDSGMVNIFVGNLSPHTREEQLLELFAAHGAVASVTIVTDRDTGQSRGIAFVEMLHSAEALSAVSSVNGTLVNGHTLRVNEGRLKPAKNPNQLSSPSSRSPPSQDLAADSKPDATFQRVYFEVTLSRSAFLPAADSVPRARSANLLNSNANCMTCSTNISARLICISATAEYSDREKLVNASIVCR
jgi:hypothetical protein